MGMSVKTIIILLLLYTRESCDKNKVKSGVSYFWEQIKYSGSSLFLSELC